MSDRDDAVRPEVELEPADVQGGEPLYPPAGELREGAATPPPPAGEPEPAGDPVAELTADLQRLSAEYANYRKRVARDQVAVAEMATAGLVERLLPVLDDIDRAREHGDLDGAFKVVGESLETVVSRFGVERFGAAGDVFDPQVHEAVMSAPEDPAASQPTCAQVFAAGYRMTSGRVLRAAKVAVAEPGAAAEAAPAPDAPAFVDPDADGPAQAQGA